MSEMREDMIQAAIKFLRDDKVKSAPLAKKIAFLESKGLSSTEIETAIQRATLSGDASSAVSAPPVPSPVPVSPGIPANQAMIQPPPLPYPIWKDVVLGLAGASAVVATVWQLIKIYRPQWIPERFRSKNDISTDPKMLANVDQALQDLKENLNSYEDDMHAIKQQLKSIQDSLSSQSRDSMHYSDILAELKSVKALLINRRQFPPAPRPPVLPEAPNPASLEMSSSGSQMVKPSLPAWQLEPPLDSKKEVTELLTEEEPSMQQDPAEEGNETAKEVQSSAELIANYQKQFEQPSALTLSESSDVSEEDLVDEELNQAIQKTSEKELQNEEVPQAMILASEE